MACRSEDERRAIEIIELLQDHNLCMLAARYASRLGKLHLADKLSDLSNTWKENNKPENSMNNFETTQDTLMTENESEDLNESIIIPVKKLNSDSLLKPIVSTFCGRILKLRLHFITNTCNFSLY